MEVSGEVILANFFYLKTYNRETEVTGVTRKIDFVR